MGILIVAAGFVCAALGIFAVAGAVYFALVRGKGTARGRSRGRSSSDTSSDVQYMSGVPFAFDSTDTDYDSGTESAGDAEVGTGDDAAGSSESYADSGSSDSGSSDSGSSDSAGSSE